MYRELARLMESPQPVRVIVEWGCGGGANAVHFAREAERFYGIDISPHSLDECRRQMDAEGLTGFRPVLIDVERPEIAVDAVGELADLFLSFYVFELLPTPEYGIRVLRTAYTMLRPGGMALVQIKYRTTDPSTRPKRWGYARNLAQMTTYPIDVFWQIAEQCHLTPLAVRLVPVQPTVNDERYAYYALRKAQDD